MKKNTRLPNVSEVMEEIEKNRNHSWIREVIRNKELADSIFADYLELGISKNQFLKKYAELNKVVIKYLIDNNITKAEVIYESFILARALKSKGFSKGDEVIACIDRTPEYIYLLGAVSIIGAELNLVSEKFEEKFLIENVLKGKKWHSLLTLEQINE